MLGKVAGTLVGGSFAILLSWPEPIVAVLGIVGAVLGHFIADAEPPSGRRVDAVFKENHSPRPSRPPRVRPAVSARERDLATHVGTLFIEVARIDGPVVQAEVRAAREYFQRTLRFGETASEALRLSLKAALAAPRQPIEPLALHVKALVPTNDRVPLVKALYALIDADGDVKRSELDALRQVVLILEVAEVEVARITAVLFGDGEQHYRTLGIAPAASDDEVKTAFRRMAAEHHPDRAPASSGERFRQVTEAYEAIRKLRGL
jgi:DnaJ like chaperone protein